MADMPTVALRSPTLGHRIPISVDPPTPDRLMRVGSAGDRLAATFAPAAGAELSSLRVREKPAEYELMYRANDWRPADGWPGRAPWLWPIAGRSYGSTVPHHGFIRHREWQWANDTALTYSPSAADQRLYPFDYTLGLRAVVDDGLLRMTFTCAASPHNEHPMPFMLGLHLSFNLARWWGDGWLAGHLEGLGLVAHRPDARKLAGSSYKLPPRVSLSDPLVTEAIVPARPGHPVRLMAPDGTRGLALRFELSDPSNGGLVWVLYRDEAGRFYCCEPWVGWPDAMNSGRGRIDLKPGQTWFCTFCIEVEGASGSIDPGISTS